MQGFRINVFPSAKSSIQLCHQRFMQLKNEFVEKGVPLLLQPTKLCTKLVRKQKIFCHTMMMSNTCMMHSIQTALEFSFL